MGFNKKEAEQSGIIFIVTKMIPSPLLGEIAGARKEYQKYSFGLTQELGEFLGKKRIHFYHIDRAVMNSFNLRDAILQNLVDSFFETKELAGKIVITVDEEIYTEFSDANGTKFESELVACLPEENAPVIYFMNEEKKELLSPYYFVPDELDKQGGRIVSFENILREEDSQTSLN